MYLHTYFNDAYCVHVAERLIMQNATFSWISTKGPATLQNINMKIPDSSLIAVVGAVGSGKSSLISAFLGDMYKISGYANTKVNKNSNRSVCRVVDKLWRKLKIRFNPQGKIAYVPQQSWILNATVKENITLGEPFEQQWYEKAINTCALQPDLNGFPSGDSTEIGEKVGLSLENYFIEEIYR